MDETLCTSLISLASFNLVKLVGQCPKELPQVSCAGNAGTIADAIEALIDFVPTAKANISFCGMYHLESECTDVCDGPCT